MRKLVVDASRVTAVHAALMADALRDESPNAAVETIRLGHGESVSEEEAQVAPSEGPRAIRPRIATMWCSGCSAR